MKKWFEPPRCVSAAVIRRVGTAHPLFSLNRSKQGLMGASHKALSESWLKMMCETVSFVGVGCCDDCTTAIYALMKWSLWFSILILCKIKKTFWDGTYILYRSFIWIKKGPASVVFLWGITLDEQKSSGKSPTHIC